MGQAGVDDLDLSDPAWFPESLDLDARAARFVRASREALSSQAFLDPKWDRSALPATAVRFDDLPPPATRPRLNFIWHTSFCCSTLIAASLDQPGKCLALKEPKVLVDLADAKRRGELARAPKLADAVLGLLSRRFAPEEQVLIKPSNGANALMPEAAVAADGQVLLLHSDCRAFLVSVAKSGEPLRAYVRSLFMTLLGDRPNALRWSPGELMRLTDLQLAAVAWQLQMAALSRAAASLGDRARALNSADFLAAPEPALNALDAFFAIGLGPEAVAQVVAGPRFGRDAKSAAAFDPARRAGEARAAVLALGEDLERIVEWSFKVCPWAAPDQALPNPLLPADQAPR